MSAEESRELPPKLAEWENVNVQRIYAILNDDLAHKPEDEHVEGYLACWIVAELVEPVEDKLKAALARAEAAEAELQQTRRALEMAASESYSTTAEQYLAAANRLAEKERAE